MFEDLIQDREVVKDLTRLSRKQSCGIGSSGGGVSTADLSALPDDLEHLQNEQLCFGGKVSGDDQGTRTGDGAEAADAVGARRGSPVTCCCGDNRGFNVRDTQRDDMTGIVVANGGRALLRAPAEQPPGIPMDKRCALLQPELHRQRRTAGKRHDAEGGRRVRADLAAAGTSRRPVAVGQLFHPLRPAWNRFSGRLPEQRGPNEQDCSGQRVSTGSQIGDVPALPAASEPLAPIGTASALRPVYAKSVVHDHFSGGVWKSLPSQPQQSHHQPQPQQQPPQPVGAGAWHSSSARHHSCSAPGAHLELGALLHGVQQNREALSSLVQHSGSSQSRPPTSLSDFGGRPGGGLQLSAESRPSTSLAPFGGAAAAAATAHALQECWSRGSPPSGPPLLRFNYDLLPSGYLHWLALARSNLARPQAMAAAFDHAQQLQQQMQQQQQQQQQPQPQQQHQSKQDMGVQTTCSTTPSSLEEADSNASDAMGTAAFATPHTGVFFASSSSPAFSP
ncbi:uncharacterized protein LOC144174118 isoform X3 [Haemaphysalis longicornis]